MGQMVNLAKSNRFFPPLIQDNGSASEISPAALFPESPNKDVNRRVAAASVIAALAFVSIDKAS